MVSEAEEQGKNYNKRLREQPVIEDYLRILNYFENKNFYQNSK